MPPKSHGHSSLTCCKLSFPAYSHDRSANHLPWSLGVLRLDLLHHQALRFGKLLVIHISDHFGRYRESGQDQLCHFAVAVKWHVCLECVDLDVLEARCLKLGAHTLDRPSIRRYKVMPLRALQRAHFDDVAAVLIGEDAVRFLKGCAGLRDHEQHEAAWLTDLSGKA